MKPAFRLALAVAAAASVPLACVPPAAGASVVDTTRELPLAVGKSTVLQTASPVLRVSVTDPAVTDVVVVSKTEVLVNGKKSGSTHLIVWTAKERRIYNVVVRTDADALQALLRGALKSDAVTAEVMGKAVVLRGSVATPELAAAAETIAEGTAEKVISLLTVDKAPQVEVTAQIVEITKNGLDQLGVKYGEMIPTTSSNPNEPGSFTFKPDGMTAAELKQNFVQFGRSRLGAQLQALFRNGQARLLAAPRMVTASGGKSDILVGGEVPVPVQQALGQTTILWKEYGVKLGVEPVVQREGRLKLKVASEVSSLDYANAVTLGSSQIPSMVTRKAGTDVVLASGESLVIGGLLQSTDSEVIDRLPFLGDIPVLGNLFRSRRFQRQETELRVVLTPRMVAAAGEAPQYKEAPDAGSLLHEKP